MNLRKQQEMPEVVEYYQSLVEARDWETTNYSPIKEYVQSHGAYLAGPNDAPSDAAFTLEARLLESEANYPIAYGVLETVYPHFSGGVATIAGHGVMQVRFSGGESGFDTRASDVPVAGTPGMFAIEPGSSIATFLCASQAVEIDSSSSFADFIVNGAGVGVYSSPQHAVYVSSLVDSGGALPFAGNRPYDHIGGDYSCINSAGVGFHVDTEMAFMRTSEICGVFAFREQGHLRVAGETLEIEGESFSRLSGEFNYELSDVEQRFIYPWEVAGSLSHDATTEVTTHGREALFDGVYAYHEPTDTLQRPIARMDVLGGYLGQGWQQIVSAPTEKKEPRGLFRQQVLMDGTYSVETAAGMLFVKTHDVPVIRRDEYPDILFDGEAYRFSGQIPEGEDPEEHIVRSLISEAISSEDYYAYISRWQSTLAGHHHPHVGVHLNGEPGTYADRTWDANGKTEDLNEQVKVDDRYGEMTVKQLLSMFGILPNGDIVMKNSDGAELRFSGGRVYIGGEGLVIDCARSVAVFADRIALRGHDDVEVVGSTGSVRLKAEQNLMMLGGNSGSGGVLIESRGDSLESDWHRDASRAVASGVVIKSASSHVSIYGGQLLCKTGGSGNGLTNGNIVLDSDTNRLMLAGADLQRHTVGELKDFFKNSAGQIINVNTYSPAATVVSGTLNVPGDVIVGKEVQAVGNLRSAYGHVYTGQAPQFSFLVEKENNAAQIESAVQIMQSTKVEIIEREILAFERLTELYAGSDRPLNPTTIGRTSFGFYDSDAYETVGGKFRRSEWHSVYGSGSPWEEPVVRYQGRYPTRPYPGQQAWNDSEALLIPSESVLIDQSTGQPKVISDDPQSRKLYEDFAVSEPVYRSFSTHFRRG